MTAPANPYTWSAPRPAIGNYAAAEPARGIKYLTPEGQRKWLSLADLAETDEKPDRVKYLRRRLAALPQYIRAYYAQRLEQLDATDPAASRKWLLNTFERRVLRRIDAVNDKYLPQSNWPAVLLPLHGDFHRLQWAGKKQLKRLAHTLADLMAGELMREFNLQMGRTGGDPEFAAISAYGCIAMLTRHLTIAVPGWRKYEAETLSADEALCAVARLQTPRWWLNKLRRLTARWREHLMIAAGYVHRKSAPYCSNPCLSEWLAQKKANREFLKAMELEDENTGERTSLIDKVAASVANPANRRRELMARMRGFEDLAKETGAAGEFYTLTAPSSYHSALSDGRRNDKYSGASPRDTQKYLCNVWARVRAEWKRHGIRVFGFRVVEPHHDATPHWHLLLFMLPEHVESARKIFRDYALAEAGNEPGAAENRFKAVPIREEFGSATGYIAKYISKNIDGYALDGDTDDETGEPLKDMARRVSAWASRWSIRQFQQIGGAPVTVWRELRKMGERELVLHPEIEEVRAAADASAWDRYVAAQGGPLVERNMLRVRLCYEVTENGNDYGDAVARIAGVYSPYSSAEPIYTRTAHYKIVPKHKPANDVAVDVDLPGRSAAPWSSVNNCTDCGGTDEKDVRQAAPPSEMAVPADRGAVDFASLNRQQRKELTARLLEEVAATKRRRQSRRHGENTGQQLTEAGERLRDFAAASGWRLSNAQIGLLLAGRSLILGGQSYRARQDGRLYLTGEAASVSTMTRVNAWLRRMGSDYRYQK